jgi:hypothetical protein
MSAIGVKSSHSTGSYAENWNRRTTDRYRPLSS